MMKILFYFTALSWGLCSGSSGESEWESLLDKNLAKWEIWLGAPHSSVADLPTGTKQSDDVYRGTPMGLKVDPKKVFSMMREGDEDVLRISGEIFGGLTTLRSYSNYHLQVKMKWGEKKWVPRLQLKRDSGILYHCHGPHGAFWKAWKACLEFQVQEKDMGDFIPLAGPVAMVRGGQEGDRWTFDPKAEERFKATGYTHARLEPDLPNGQWNTLDLYVLGDSAIHVVNGVPVMAFDGALDKDGKRLVKGQIQLQSEAAECYYKGVRIREIKSFPEEMKKAVFPSVSAAPGKPTPPRP